jgi:hypothetical protein
MKDLFLVPRLLYSIIFVGLAMSATGLTDLVPGVLFFTLVFVLSFMWQYFVLHFVLKRIATPQRRIVILLVWMIAAILVGGWSLIELATFDYVQSDDADVVLRSFVQQLTIYRVACEMFIAGACARRAFQKYGALG